MTRLIHSGAALFLLWGHGASAAILYVNIANAHPAPPFTNWSTAATNIQDAINVANNGDFVLITNGAYPGGIITTNALTLQSITAPPSPPSTATTLRPA